MGLPSLELSNPFSARKKSASKVQIERDSEMIEEISSKMVRESGSAYYCWFFLNFDAGGRVVVEWW